MSTFSGLTASLSAIQAQKARMGIANQNIANANTAGYTRQRVELDSIGPVTTSSLYGETRKIGDGVQVNKITRMMDDLALKRLRDHEAAASFNTTTNQIYTEVENRLAEPGDTGLTAVLGDFFAGWADLANNPGADAPRAALLQEATNVVHTITTAHADLEAQWNNTKTRAEVMVDDINEAATGIAKLNEEIRMAVKLNNPASELQDERDKLLTKLSQLAGAQTTYLNDGQVAVTLGGQNLVEPTTGGTLSHANPVAVTTSNTTDVPTIGGLTLKHAKGGPLNTAAPPVQDPLPITAVIHVNATAVAIDTGELGASLTALNTTLPEVSASYDDVAKALADKVNTAQAAGFQQGGSPAGTDMFTVTEGYEASTLTIPSGFTGANIAASALSGESLNGENALEVAAVATATDGPIATWQDMVGTIGVAAAGTQVAMTTQEIQRGAAEDRLASLTSVDIDEEVAMLVETQRAYQAAARMLTAVDEALDQIINRMGRVGL